MGISLYEWGAKQSDDNHYNLPSNARLEARRNGDKDVIIHKLTATDAILHRHGQHKLIARWTYPRDASGGITVLIRIEGDDRKLADGTETTDSQDILADVNASLFEGRLYEEPSEQGYSLYAPVTFAEYTSVAEINHTIGMIAKAIGRWTTSRGYRSKLECQGGITEWTNDKRELAKAALIMPKPTPTGDDLPFGTTATVRHTCTPFGDSTLDLDPLFAPRKTDKSHGPRNWRIIDTPDAVKPPRCPNDDDVYGFTWSGINSRLIDDALIRANADLDMIASEQDDQAAGDAFAALDTLDNDRFDNEEFAPKCTHRKAAPVRQPAARRRRGATLVEIASTGDKMEDAGRVMGISACQIIGRRRTDPTDDETMQILEHAHRLYDHNAMSARERDAARDARFAHTLKSLLRDREQDVADASISRTNSANQPWITPEVDFAAPEQFIRSVVPRHEIDAAHAEAKQHNCSFSYARMATIITVIAKQAEQNDDGAIPGNQTKGLTRYFNTAANGTQIAIAKRLAIQAKLIKFTDETWDHDEAKPQRMAISDRLAHKLPFISAWRARKQDAAQCPAPEPDTHTTATNSTASTQCERGANSQIRYLSSLPDLNKVGVYPSWSELDSLDALIFSVSGSGGVNSAVFLRN